MNRCDRCDLVFVTKGKLKWHNDSCHSDKPLQCEQCEYKCGYKFSLKRHKRTHIVDKDLVNRCEPCNRVFVTKGKLRWHNSSCHIDKPLQCERCNYKCVNKSSLNKHKRKLHETDIQNEAAENLDNYDIYEEEDLVKDEKVKNEEVECEILMEEPLEQNEGEKPTPPIENCGMIIKCDDCSYSSQNEDISKLHLLSHKYSETELVKMFPPTLKNLTFASEEEFSKNLGALLESLSGQTSAMPK